MLPILTAIGTGLSSIVSAIKNLLSDSSSDKTARPPPTGDQHRRRPRRGATVGAAREHRRASRSTEQQDRFLKLLVTQMKNQDPLNPLDNAQVTTQLAQINTVSGIEKLNTTVQALSSSMLANAVDAVGAR